MKIKFERKNSFIFFILSVLFTLSCTKTSPENEEVAITDDELLTIVQKQTFKYFWDYAESNSKLARERFHEDYPFQGENTVATGGSGFGLMALLVAIERGFITRQEAVDRLEIIVKFLKDADRFHGAWSHWIDGRNGNVIPFSPEDNGGDLVETSFLAQGIICVREYFKNGSAQEQAIAQEMDDLWQSIEWDWYTNSKEVLYWHWSPTNHFGINLEVRGYNESLITYILAASSPTHPIDKEVYDIGWAKSGGITSSKTKYGLSLVLNHNGAQEYGGPLFWSHYSYLGLDPNGLSDQYANYWNLNINHATINYKYCLENPKNFAGYHVNSWGLTASYTRNSDGSVGYSAHAPNNDRGVISPTAAVSSIVYTPKESLKAIRYFYLNQNSTLWGTAGFYDAYSPHYNWVTKRYLAIDQGPIVVMIENYRTKLLWKLFMNAPEIKEGLTKLGFSSPYL